MSPFRARAALGAAVALLGCASALPTAADAAVTSTVDGAGLHITSDDQSDAITLAKAGGVITINGTATTQVASINTAISVDAGGGNDVVDASALIATDYATLTVHGGNGNDTLTGGANGDALSGDDGDDRLVGFKNPAFSLDVLEGGAGDDAIVWNNGDGTDIADGGADFDFVEVNGSTGDDEFTIAPGATAGHVQFNRISLNGATAGNFEIDSTTIEELTVNGLGGNDRATGAAGLAALLPKGLALNGGDGNDVLTGGDTNDAIDGGTGNDLLTGFKGLDTIFGGDGNDTSVWNNGDGSDLFDGGDGSDEQVVNGSPTGDDEFTIAPGEIAGHVEFNRISLNGAPAGNFGIESTTTEQLTVNGLGGNDRATGAVGLAAILPALTLNGGDGNDVLTGGDGADTLDGGTGDDTLIGAKGIDTMLGGDGNDTNVWNNGDASDLFDGGNDTDVLQVNGSSTGDDEFTIAPGTRAGHVQFDRISLNGATAGNFGIDNTTIEQVQVNGLGGNDRATGSAGLAALLPQGLALNGGDGDDILTGGDSADAIDGGAGDDNLSGGAGNDTLTSGGGLDLLDGGAGDDMFNARDGDGDAVRGGPGTDSATTDATTIDTVAGVENLDATPVPPVTAAPPPPPIAPAVVKDDAAVVAVVAAKPADTKALAPSLGAVTVTRRGNALTARLRVSCPAAEAGGCSSTLTIATRHAVKLGTAKAVVVLGSAKVKLAGGHAATVSIRLASGTASLASSGKLATTVSVVSRDAARNIATASAARTLILPKRR